MPLALIVSARARHGSGDDDANRPALTITAIELSPVQVWRGNCFIGIDRKSVILFCRVRSVVHAES
jgi:hypothetical protein